MLLLSYVWRSTLRTDYGHDLLCEPPTETISNLAKL